MALWCPDWPVVAAMGAGGVPPNRPAAVLLANRVLACSSVARARGVRRGLRGREAQARCPDVLVLPADPERDARMFERVARAVEELTPGVEVVRPGLLVMLAKGPVGYYRSVRSVAERLIDQVASKVGVECQIGVADGLFAATLAAHRGVEVEPGRSREFLAPLEVGELDREPEARRAELIELLRRLGLRSLGAFAALPVEDVASRFGADAVLAHRLAAGLEPRQPARRRPPEEMVVEVALDPPVTRVDAVAFASRALSDQLHQLLAGHGLACTRLGIWARTAGGVELARTWRCAEPLTPAGTVDRVRWQLDAWLTGRATRSDAGAGEADGPSGINALRLSAEQVVLAGELQLGLWGDVGAADERAGRALVRVQAMLGPDGVCTAVVAGGRDPAERVRLVPWGDERAEPVEGGRGRQERPWPGRLPAPSPSTVPVVPIPAEVLDSSGRPVQVTERALLSAAPAWVGVGGERPAPVRGWAGPWPVDQRWWDSASGWRGSRVQVVLGGGGGLPVVGAAEEGGLGESAFLLLHRDGRWSVIGGYG
jgi:protein ImuB